MATVVNVVVVVKAITIWIQTLITDVNVEYANASGIMHLLESNMRDFIYEWLQWDYTMA